LAVKSGVHSISVPPVLNSSSLKAFHSFMYLLHCPNIKLNSGRTDGE